jgi:hypothetical protein
VRRLFGQLAAQERQTELQPAFLHVVVSLSGRPAKQSCPA